MRYMVVGSVSPLAIGPGRTGYLSCVSSQCSGTLFILCDSNEYHSRASPATPLAGVIPAICPMSLRSARGLCPYYVALMRTTVELTPVIAFGRGHTGYLLRPSRALDGLTILCDSK